MNNPEIKSESQIKSEAKKVNRKKGLILLIILALLAGVGVITYYYKKDSNSKAFVQCVNSGGKLTTVGKTTTCVDKNGKEFQLASNNVKTEPWKLFQGELASLNYPSDWSVTKPETPSIYKNQSLIRLTSPNDSTLVVDPADSSEHKLGAVLAINPSTKITRKINARILAAKEFVFLPSAKKAKLVALDTNTNGKADLIALGTASANVGDASVSGYFDFNDQYQLSLQTSIASSKSASNQDQIYEAKNADELLNSKSVSSLALILSNLKLK